MATTYYHAVNGQLLGETTAGARIDYLTDILGSVVGTVDQNQNSQCNLRYKPFGSRLSQSGAVAVLRFQYCGNSSLSETGSLDGALYSTSEIWNLFSAQQINLAASNIIANQTRNIRAMLPPGTSQECDLSKGGWPVHYNSMEPIPVPRKICGGWGSWFVAFDGPATIRGTGGSAKHGYIIQEINFKKPRGVNCITKLPLIALYGDTEYWELWYIDGKGNIRAFEDFRIDSPPHDTWSSPDSYLCTTGSKAELGWLKFYNVSINCYKEWGYTRGNPWDPRKDLLGGYNPPAGWSRANSTARQARAMWNCCDSKLFTFPRCPSISVIVPSCKDNPTICNPGPLNA